MKVYFLPAVDDNGFKPFQDWENIVYRYLKGLYIY